MSGYNYGDDGGGFVQGGTQAPTQGGGEKSYTRDSLRPVTIKQVLDAQEVSGGPTADFYIDGELVTQLSFVGQIRKYSRQSTSEAFTLDDGTSIIDAKKFLTLNEGEEAPAEAQWEENMWVHAFGRLKVFGGNRSINIHLVRPVASYDEVNYHMLEAAMVHAYFARQSQNNGMGGGVGGDGMFVDGNNDTAMGGYSDSDMAAKLRNCSTSANKFWNAFKMMPRSNEGTRSEAIAVKAGLTLQQANDASVELLSYGLIYTTMDDSTFDILEC